MKILLIYPLKNITPKELILKEPGWMPLGLSFVASSLIRSGHTVKIFDRYMLAVHSGLTRQEIDRRMLEEVKSFSPDMIGFNTVSPLIYDTVHCLRHIRPLTTATLIAGGHHITALPELALEKMVQLDAVIAGEGEISTSRLADGDRYESIPGLAYRTASGSTAFNHPEKISSLDALPFPALDLMNTSFYLKKGTRTIKGHYLSVLPILTSRGCTRKCVFCTESLTYGNGVRFHSQEYVLGWIEMLLSKYRFEALYIHDNNFLADLERAALLCEQFIRKGINRRLIWAAQARADSLSPEIVRLMKKAGCISIEIGIESQTQAVLDRIDKGTNVEMNSRAINLCRKEGIAVHAFILTCTPNETVKDLDRTLTWIASVNPTSFSMHPLAVHPGTRLYSETGNGFFEKHDWTEPTIKEYYSADTMSSVTREERDRWRKGRYEPFLRRKAWFSLLRLNSFPNLLKLVWDRFLAIFSTIRAAKGINKPKLS